LVGLVAAATGKFDAVVLSDLAPVLPFLLANVKQNKLALMIKGRAQKVVKCL
jgi:hypothetical protein